MTPIADGNVVYQVVTAPAVSADPGYSGLDAADVTVTNLDNDTAGLHRRLRRAACSTPSSATPTRSRSC